MADQSPGQAPATQHLVAPPARARMFIVLTVDEGGEETVREVLGDAGMLTRVGGLRLPGGWPEPRRRDRRAALGPALPPQFLRRGSFMELSWGGKEPLQLADGREQTFLEDGQSVTLRTTAPGPNGSVIDFGECVGRITAARGSGE